MPAPPFAFRILLFALALLLILLTILVLAGVTTLVAWGTALTIRARGPRLARLGWNLLFLVLPGPAHLAFALTRATPPRFRALALGVSLSIVGFVVTAGTTVALMWMAGIPIKAGGGR